MRHNVDLVQIVATQNEIIKEQSDVIDTLFQQLCQLLPTEELEALPLYAIKHAANLKKEVEDNENDSFEQS